MVRKKHAISALVLALASTMLASAQSDCTPPIDPASQGASSNAGGAAGLMPDAAGLLFDPGACVGNGLGAQTLAHPPFDEALRVPTPPALEVPPAVRDVTDALVAGLGPTRDEARHHRTASGEPPLDVMSMTDLMTAWATGGVWFWPAPAAAAAPAAPKVERNKKFFVGRIAWFGRRSRADIIIHDTKPVDPPPPTVPPPISTCHGNVNGGDHVTVPIGTVPTGGYVGTGGAGPCIGVLVWDSKDIYVFHFNANDDDIAGTLKEVLSGLGSGATGVVFGNDDSPSSNEALEEAAGALNGNPNISGGAGFVNAGSAYVQVGAGGSVSAVVPAKK